MSQIQHVEREVEDGVTVVSFPLQNESFGEDVVVAISQPVLDAAQVQPPLVVVDLKNVTFFGSAFIELLFRLWNRLKTNNGRLVLCNVQPYCREVLDVTNLSKVWQIFPNRADAVAGVSRAGS